ncbi:MAG: hypothetical protein GWN58_31145, partial [Anaerolineae bacterium]|nr:hypothetical protein [Anaerolineae bacterium]
LQHDRPLRVRARYRVREPLADPIVKVRLVRSDGAVCALTASHHMPDTGWVFSDQGEVTVVFDPIQLTSGSYTAEVRIADSSDTVLLASGQSSHFQVQGPALLHEPDQGAFVPNTVWSHTGNRN